MAALSRQPEIMPVVQTLGEFRYPNDRSDQARMSLDGRQGEFGPRKCCLSLRHQVSSP
jgi:hypothetical protein